MPQTLLKLIFVAVAMPLINGVVYAQFGDDATSKAKLANACAISGGGNAEDYQSYASSLAVTLSHLSAAEQEEVLDGTASGTPSGGSGEGESGTGSGDTGGDAGGTGGGEEEGTGGGPGGWGSGGGISSWFTSNTLADPGKGNVFAVVLEEPQNATAAISFTNAPITESVISGEFSMVTTQDKTEPSATSGTMTQSVDPSGKPIFRAEDNKPRKDATVSFKDGKLSFGPKKESHEKKGGAE